MTDREKLPLGCERIDVRINNAGLVKVFGAGQMAGSEWLPAILTVEGWKAKQDARNASKDDS